MKNKTTAGILAIFLGTFGIHKFYLGEKSSGIFYLVFCWTNIPRILGIIDGITLLKMSESDFNQKYNNEQSSPSKQFDQQSSSPTMQPIWDSSQISSLEQLEKMREDGTITIEQYLKLKEQWMNRKYGN